MASLRNLPTFFDYSFCIIVEPRHIERSKRKNIPIFFFAFPPAQAANRMFMA